MCDCILKYYSWEESKAEQNEWDIPHRIARIYSCKEQGVHIGSKTIQGTNYHSALLVGRITTTVRTLEPIRGNVW